MMTQNDEVIMVSTIAGALLIMGKEPETRDASERLAANLKSLSPEIFDAIMQEATRMDALVRRKIQEEKNK